MGDMHQPLHLTGRDKGGNGGDYDTIIYYLVADGMMFLSHVPL